VGNFYADNADLRRRLSRVPWDQLLPGLERDFSQGDLGGPSDLEEAREQIDMVLDTVGRIASDEIAPHAAEVDRQGARLVDGRVVYPEPMRRAFGLLSEAGLLGLTLPREHGGMDLPMVAYTAVVEMIGRADAALMTIFALQGCGETIHRFGTSQMHEQWLPRLAAGETTAAMALTEPGAGSALDTVQTRAAQDPDGTWRLTGSKCFITNGGADVLLVLARSEQEMAGAQGLSMFVVEPGEGVEVAKLESKLGIHGSPTAVLNLDGAKGVLLGGRGAGLFPVAMSLMNSARLEVASQAVGIAQAAQVQAVRYAHERQQRRRTIDLLPPVRSMLFDNALQIEAARAIILKTAEVLDRQQAAKRTGDEDEAARFGHLADLLTPLAKYTASEMASEVASRSIQVHGGYGYMMDYPVERHFRDARITSIYEGTSQIQVSTMIGLLLQGGLPLMFGDLVETAVEPAGCEGLRSQLRECYAMLDGAVSRMRRAGKQAWQGWARRFADATADLYSALIFLHDARADARATVLAQAQTRHARRSARLMKETVDGDDRIAFEEESFAKVIGPYRPQD